VYARDYTLIIVQDKVCFT